MVNCTNKKNFTFTFISTDFAQGKLFTYLFFFKLIYYLNKKKKQKIIKIISFFLNN